MNKLKVIVCTDGIFPYQIGGMQRHSRSLIAFLAKVKQVELVVLHPHSEDIFSSELEIKEIKIHPIDINKNYLLECYKYSKRVYAELLKYPDHIIYSQGLSVWYGIKKLSSRIVINPHGLESFQSITLKDKIISIPFKLIFNYLFKHATKIVSLGGKLTFILQENISMSQQKIVEIPNAVVLPEVEIAKKYLHSKLKLLFIARFAHNKGIHILIEAIKQLNEEGYVDKLAFNLGGKGPLFNHYSTTCTFSNVNYLGLVSDEQLANLYQTQDIFVLPTLFEGMPTVILEAMSYGLPIIVSDVGATAELVDGTNGYLISKNSIHALKNAIVEFYQLNNSAKNELSQASVRKVKENYTWEIVAKKHLELFENMVSIK